MKISRFNQFVKENLNEEDRFEDQTVGSEFDENNFEEETPEEGFEDSKDEFGNETDDTDMMDDEEAPMMRPSKNVRSFDDFQSDDEDISDEENFGDDFTENEPDEQDYMPSFEEEDDDFGGEEEEAGEYKGEVEMKRLADILGSEVINNQIEYNGKKINYYSETEMFHVDKKKFETAEEVVDYLEGGTGSMSTDMERNPMNMEEETPTEEDGLEEEMPKDMAMESRRFRRR